MKRQINIGKLTPVTGPLLAFAILIIVAVWAVGPVQAQNYGSNYPVCLHLYDEGGDRLDCAYNSLAQCAASASGRSAACEANPYATRAQDLEGHSRHRDARQGR